MKKRLCAAMRTCVGLLIVVSITAWLVAVGASARAADCKPGGCSGQLCTDKEGMMSTCEWRPEYDCIKKQKCERQSDGNCGWTKTPESEKCFGKTDQQVVPKKKNSAKKTPKKKEPEPLH